jgi:hypothetical protein
MSDDLSTYERVATTTSRHGFLARVGAALITVAGVGVLVPRGEARPKPGDLDFSTNFCGHTWTTGNCPHPTGLPRVDSTGKPLRASDGKQIDDLGRVVDDQNRPIDDTGAVLLDPDGNELPRASRTPVCAATAKQYNITTRLDGSWYRCCGGHVRRLRDCCSTSETRINGDAALDGYCHHGRKVFCVVYIDTKVKC